MTRPAFPLYLHPTGQWAKKVRGRTHYFGTDRATALDRWLAVKDDLLAGRTPRPVVAGLELRELVNRFLTSKESLVNTGELSHRTWGTYFETAQRVLSVFGKTRPVESLGVDDFERLRAALAKGRGVVSLGNEIQRVRSLFKYAWDQGLIERPVRFGVVFRKPSKKQMRAAKNSAESWIIEAEDLRRLLEAAEPIPRAMILLGINCGFGNTDVASLPQSALDLGIPSWVNFPRTKTATLRRCPLWPETAEALRQAITMRPAAKHEKHAGLVFLTARGLPCVRVKDRGPGKPGVVRDAVRAQFDRLLVGLGLKRRGRAFYCLRHTFRTVADGARDQPAAALIMGHTDPSMAGIYRERIDDDRLGKVADTVREWLWPRPKIYARKARHPGSGKEFS